MTQPCTIPKSTARSKGFPCHLSADDNSENEDGSENEHGGFVFGEKTQHCAGAVMMFLRDGFGSGWPGINNDDDLAEKLELQMDWKAPHFETEEDFIAASKDGNRQRKKA